MDDQRIGPCLCCNTPLKFSAQEWAQKINPALLCNHCLELVRAEKILWQEVRVIYILRSQVGWLLNEVVKLQTLMNGMCEAQQELQAALFEG